MRKVFDLSKLEWTLCGYTPCTWRCSYSMETGVATRPEVGPVSVSVPGSVQKALLDAGIIPDWNMGMNARACEWVENRDWIFRTEIPSAMIPENSRVVLKLDGLDGNGVVKVNGHEVGAYDNAFIPYRFEIGGLINPDKPTRLEIVFELPPRWLGQIGYTSKFTQWKPRFNYTWDWVSRLVQIGIWDGVSLEVGNGSAIEQLRCVTCTNYREGTGDIELSGEIFNPKPATLKISLNNQKKQKVFHSSVSAEEFNRAGFKASKLPVSLWWPNGLGKQHLYQLKIELVGENGAVEDIETRMIGFRSVEWKKCEGAPENADPWICVVNGTPVFLQGVNWTPRLSNFADVKESDTLRLVKQYKEMGCNLLRVWGGATLEKEFFYNVCNKHGMMVWQEFPLSSSGIENCPPEDEKSIKELSSVARSYISRRQHHPSLILWCGGNELWCSCMIPTDISHPLIGKFAEIVKEMDPLRRFLPTSPSGPRSVGDEKEFGKGVHWDVHGPWNIMENDMEKQRRYWSSDDAMFRSETGCPGASSAALTRKYSGELDPLPVSLDNPLWGRTSWWFDWPEFAKEKGRAPVDLEEYADWSQERQAIALEMAAKAAKSRFPRCGGFLIWMGHDCFPCTVNTSIIDFEGRPKKAVSALAKIFKKKDKKS